MMMAKDLQDKKGGIMYPISDQTWKWSSRMEIVSVDQHTFRETAMDVLLEFRLGSSNR